MFDLWSESGGLQLILLTGRRQMMIGDEATSDCSDVAYSQSLTDQSRCVKSNLQYSFENKL